MKTDIFKVLEDIDSQNIKSYEDNESHYSPYMVMKWMSSTRDPKQLQLVNGLLNLTSFMLSKEKKLLYYLSISASDGKQKRYNWIKRPKQIPTVIVDVVSSYYEITPKEAIESIPYISKSDIIDMGISLGYTDSEIKKLKKSVDDSQLL